MEIEIRQAEIKDIDKILEIVNYEILNSTVLYDYKKRTYDQQLKWFEQKKADGMPVIVAENNTTVVGFGTYGIFRPWAAYQFSIEHSIYVSKDSRANGVGKKLISRLIELAKEGGFHMMIAGVDGLNEKSIDFHKKFGFQEIGTFKEVGFKFDKWLDLKFLQLFLD
ncbi:GNAT family N-acetyltransferase [Galbibacter sp. EGI 63066]|uniref:GNAT family N-acetyltransferase n=1 Tax=Galbibacter sp. EGI 63066 TaxID=2993559 RepID=UPI00224923A4|nr:GNAT family N-acetyltransferase [Galbibacter sp. EGI 63066]MCX2681330.1 GNAT family N-acetyltransferase [Galbibacter sp. EGI 63066]